MEYVNINSITTEYLTDIETRDFLLKKNDSVTQEDYVITTDKLELLRGQELIEKAKVEGRSILPLKRVSLIKRTQRFPKRVLLELTSKCNSYCTMCPRNFLTREEKHMETSLAKLVIKQLAEVGISGLWLYNIGESLLHPDFFEILKYCREFDSLGTIWLSTNGEILSQEMRKKVLDEPVDILNYSVNAVTEKQFKKIAPTLHFNNVQDNLKQLIKEKVLRQQAKPIIRAQMVQVECMLDEIEQFKEFYGNAVDILAFNKQEFFSQNTEQKGEKGKEVLNERIQKCNRLEREDFFIFSDGSVSCCDTDFNCLFNLGNVNRQSIRDIYDGDRYQGIIQKYRQGILHTEELCSKCRDYGL